eukprot:EG_transcript_34386
MKWVPAKGREGSRVSTLSSFDFQFHHKKGPRPPEEDGEDEFKEGEWHASLSVAATNRLRLKLGLRPLDSPAKAGWQLVASKRTHPSWGWGAALYPQRRRVRLTFNKRVRNQIFPLFLLPAEQPRFCSMESVRKVQG